jgi:hypothetical protein
MPENIQGPELIVRLNSLLKLDWSHGCQDHEEVHRGIEAIRNDLIEQEIEEVLQANPGITVEGIVKILPLDADDAISDVVHEMIRTGKVTMKLELKDQEA